MIVNGQQSRQQNHHMASSTEKRCLDQNWSWVDPADNNRLAERLNEDMKASVLPVTTIVGIETVFGFFGNILILYVFLFHYHKCNFKYFVLCLSFIDTTSTLTTMPGEMVTQTFWYVYPVPIVCKIKSFFNMFTVCGSAFCLLVISIDRYRKICRPLEWQIKPRIALSLCFATITFAFILALPVPFFWGTHSYLKQDRDGRDVIVTVCEKDAEFKCTSYPFVYTVVAETITTFTMIVMFVLYVLICRKLWKSKTSDAEVSNPKNNCMNHIESKATLCGGVSSEDERASSSSDGATRDVSTLPTQTGAETNDDLDNKAQMVFSSLRGNAKVAQIPNGRSKTTFSRLSKIGNPESKHDRRVRRKTLIMFILTAVFIMTTVLYMVLLNLIANDVLQSLTLSQKAVYFFFFRLYFINHVINPILYGLLDPYFRRILKQSWRSLLNGENVSVLDRTNC